MTTRTGKDLTTLDFGSIKSNLKEYMKSQKIFQDYDFEGSNINVLLDVLSYNTNLNAFYLNMIANEMFLDSALLRDSIISHAKELNYLPRSFRSAQARVRITLRGQPNSGVVIPRGSKFTGTSGNRNFTFVTGENISLDGDGNTFVADDVTLYEGTYASDTYVVSSTNPARYVITNKTVDTNSIAVTVLEDNGESTLAYSRSSTLFGLDKNSQVFFIQPAANESYEIVFGDGVVGRPPKDRSVVIIQYRVGNGELPNGVHTFVSNDTSINGMTVLAVDTIEPARGGSVPESLASIKLNAPRAFTTQERAVSASDYEILLKKQFSDINDVSAYGGEQADPPQFGKVIIAVDLKTSDSLPPSRAREFANYIRPRSPLSIDPVFVTPEYMYVRVNSKVKYNINQTSLSISDIKSIVQSQIQDYNNAFLDGFNKTLHYSRFVTAIDEAQSSIVSNDTELLVVREFVPTIRREENYTINFDMPLKNDTGFLGPRRYGAEKTIITSSPFYFQGVQCTIEDNGNHILRIMTKEHSSSTQKVALQNVGVVDYEKGVCRFERFAPQALINDKIAIFARTFDKDITSKNRTILSIRDPDVRVEVQQVRL